MRWSPSRSAPSSAPRVRCLDETGLRIGGKTQWLHTTATETLTLYRACAKRGAMPEGLEGGGIVYDGFKPYRNLDGAPRPHALCNAHHLRELKALIALDNEPWATGTRDCLRDACQAVGEARAEGETALSPAALQTFHARYREALREGLAWHRSLPRLEKAGSKSGWTKQRAGDNLLLRLHRFKTTSSGSRSTSTHPSPTISPSDFGRCFRVVQEAERSPRISSRLYASGPSVIEIFSAPR